MRKKINFDVAHLIHIAERSSHTIRLGIISTDFEFPDKNVRLEKNQIIFFSLYSPKDNESFIEGNSEEYRKWVTVWQVVSHNYSLQIPTPLFEEIGKMKASNIKFQILY